MTQVLLLGGALGCNTAPDPCPTIDGEYRITYRSPGLCAIEEVVVPIVGSGQSRVTKAVQRPDTTVYSTTDLRGCVMDLEITVVRNNNNKTVSLVDGRVAIDNDDTSYLVGAGFGVRFDEAYPDRTQVLCSDYIEMHAAREPSGFAGAPGVY